MLIKDDMNADEENIQVASLEQHRRFTA